MLLYLRLWTVRYAFRNIENTNSAKCHYLDLQDRLKVYTPDKTKQKDNW